MPFEEHRTCLAFKHLDNPFVQNILEAYWVAYKAFGVGLYAELSYHGCGTFTSAWSSAWRAAILTAGTRLCTTI